MIGVDVRSNLKQVAAEFRQYTEKVTDKALVRALNRALDQSATAANREIRKTYNLKASAVAKTFNKKRTFQGSLLPAATLEIKGARIGLIEFAARQNRTGVSVSIKVGGGRKTVPHAFITTVRSGYTGVFRRTGKARYPIKTLRSISVPRAFLNRVVLQAVKAVAVTSFMTNYRQQIKFLGARNG